MENKMNYSEDIKGFGFTFADFHAKAEEYNFASGWNAKDVWTALDNFRSIYNAYPKNVEKFVIWCIVEQGKMETIDEKTYYELMENMHHHSDFETLHNRWLRCFKYILNSFNIGYTDKIAEHLFYHFEMRNWKTLWKENSEFKDYSKEQLIKVFGLECIYIADRMCYDRLFRTHWLFLEAFKIELLKIKYPN